MAYDSQNRNNKYKRNSYGNNGNNKNNKTNENKEIEKIINNINSFEKLSDMSAKDFADEKGYADVVAKNSKNLKTNQLRKFFGAVRVMEHKTSWDEIEPEFYLLKPRLAVSVARNNVPKPFYKLIMKTMEKVDVGTEEDKLNNFNTFVNFFESIVAYHKFYNGDK